MSEDMQKEKPILTFKNAKFYSSHIELVNARFVFAIQKVGLLGKIKYDSPWTEFDAGCYSVNMDYTDIKYFYDKKIQVELDLSNLSFRLSAIINKETEKALQNRTMRKIIDHISGIEISQSSKFYIYFGEFVDSAIEINDLKHELPPLTRELISNAKYRSRHVVYIKETATSSSSLSLTDELLKLKSLLDSGALTQQEFDIMKAKIING